MLYYVNNIGFVISVISLGLTALSYYKAHLQDKGELL